MTEDHADFGFGRIIVAILGEVTQPYKNFVGKLHAEGRVTDAEAADLVRALRERCDQLADRLPALLREDRGAERL